ncbi:hypothetical protein [Amycolatopsis sp. NPDC051128]|uniref:effector-associated constant component EACC1 n=1 Tax=Amycolatopsis sp. NPDC051128 TaxID=3155412 RepID=UPI003437A145
MEAELRLSGNGAAEGYPLLWDWLDNERALRGRVRWTSGTPGGTSLGAPDWITVVLGAGGAGTVLAASLGKWLSRAERPDLRLKITRRGRTGGEVEEVEVEVGRLTEDNRRFLAELLRPGETVEGDDGNPDRGRGPDAA